jgi:hypothetical protein
VRIAQMPQWFLRSGWINRSVKDDSIGRDLG